MLQVTRWFRGAFLVLMLAATGCGEPAKKDTRPATQAKELPPPETSPASQSSRTEARRPAAAEPESRLPEEPAAKAR